MPPLYSLVDLMDAPIAGYYYKEQLTKGEEPDRASFFRTEKIIRTAYEKGRKKFLVKTYITRQSLTDGYLKMIC